jgi:vacuolar protein sorting-associated protein IST1
LDSSTPRRRFYLFIELTSSGETPEPSISDAVCAIVYAAPRTELKELQVLREILMHKVGGH